MLKLWYECLNDCGYTFEEFLLSPTQLGIPNHRTRYYMVCERSKRFSCQVRRKDDVFLSKLPPLAARTGTSELDHQSSDTGVEMKSVSDYIIQEEYDEVFTQSLMVPDGVFEKKWVKDLGIVCPLDKSTHCFTAAYGRQLHRATGSLLLIDPDRKTSVANFPIDRSKMQEYKGMLRRFGPSELLRLFGFPSGASFPEEISLSHQFKLIGNSVNVAGKNESITI